MISIINVIKAIFLDKTVLNMVSLLMSGTGIFSVLSQFYIPKKPDELHMTFLGSNPFAIKYNYQMSVKNLTDNLFIGMATLGLLIQVPLIIYDDELYKLNLEKSCYWLIFAALVFLVALLVLLISYFAKRQAKKRWLSEVIQSQKAAFEQAKDILFYDGWRTDQLNVKDRIADPEKYRRANFESAEKHIAQIERLLEIRNSQHDLTPRLKILERYFE